MVVMLVPLFGSFFCFFDWFFGLLSLFVFFLFSSFFIASKSFFCNLFIIDFFSLFFVLLIIWVTFLVIISSVFDFVSSGYMTEFVFFFTLSSLLLSSCFCFSNFLGFYLMFEMVFFIFFVLLLIWSYSPERFQSSYYMLFYTLFVTFPFLFFILFISENNFNESFIVFSVLFKGTGFWWILMVLIFMVKLPTFALHLWLPKAHVEAPLGGSMLLAGVLLKLGGYGLIRLGKEISSEISLSSYFFSLGLVGGLITCFLCLRQIDFKALVAYSSVCHMGMVLVGLLLFTTHSLIGSYLLMIFHGLVSSGLFMLLFFLYVRYGSRSIFLGKSLILTVPFLSFWCFLFISLNISAPPSLGFFSEILILGPTFLFSFFLSMWMFFMLLFVAIYNVFLFCFMSHGNGILSYYFGDLEVREQYLFLMHSLPCFLVVLFLNLLLIF